MLGTYGEFGNDINALADEILRYRFCVAQLVDATQWMQDGKMFIAMPPAQPS